MTEILHYPRRNRIGVAPEWIARELSIVERIDLMSKPLTVEQYLRRPMVRRGRWLLRCWDANSRCYRQFYENAFRENWRDVDLRIGEFVNGKIIPVSRPFQANEEDRQILSGLLWRLRERKEICVFADGLRIVRDQ